MRKIVVSGKSVQEAIQIGLIEMNVSVDRVHVHVIDQPTKGFVGFGSKEARVELELIPNPIQDSIDFLNGMFKEIHISADAVEDISLDGPVINIRGNRLGILIGKKGQTLDALQNIINLVANRNSSAHVRIILDAENFRSKRKRSLERLATESASQVINMNKEIRLEPMNASDRKIIHFELQDHPIVKTYSVGEEPNRCVVVALR
jgi:spoIIIJ-associated protein